MAEAYGKMSDEKKWKAENDLSTLIEAEKIKKDPARMKMVMQCKKEKTAAMDAIGK